MKDVGTLQELGVKPGDVVEVIGGKKWEVVGIDGHGNYLINDPPARCLSRTLPFRIISRASDTPTLWRDMTPAEKGALLLAHHEGKVIEYRYGCSDVWRKCAANEPVWEKGAAYRVKPADSVVETVTLYGAAHKDNWPFERNVIASYDTHRITFQTIDGKPDCASIRMEPLK